MYTLRLIAIDDVLECEAYVDDCGECWNGWLMPFFTPEQACTMMDKVIGNYDVFEISEYEYDKENGTFKYKDDNDEYTYEYELVEFDTEDGKLKGFAIGSGSWIWSYVYEN